MGDDSVGDDSLLLNCISKGASCCPLCVLRAGQAVS